MNIVMEKAEKKNNENYEEQARKLYESLNISETQFLQNEEIGNLHEKQMQSVYRDFQNNVYNK